MREVYLAIAEQRSAFDCPELTGLDMPLLGVLPMATLGMEPDLPNQCLRKFRAIQITRPHLLAFSANPCITIPGEPDNLAQGNFNRHTASLQSSDRRYAVWVNASILLSVSLHHQSHFDRRTFLADCQFNAQLGYRYSH